MILQNTNNCIKKARGSGSILHAIKERHEITGGGFFLFTEFFLMNSS